MHAMQAWPPSTIQVADSKEKIFVLMADGYRLCVEPDCAFMCEGFPKYANRPRIPVTDEAAKAAIAYKANGGLREMTDTEVRKKLHLDPRNRKFYLMVV